MTRYQRKINQNEEAFNPFETKINTTALMQSLNSIDSSDFRGKFKTTKDPIAYAFQSIESAPLETLAKDFITEGLSDIIHFISKICK